MDYKIEKISYILHLKYDIKKLEECNTDEEKSVGFRMNMPGSESGG